MQNISLHRFHDLVALTLPGAETVYLSHEEAAKLAKHIKALVKDIESCTYLASSVSTLEVEVPGNIGSYRKGVEIDRLTRAAQADKRYTVEREFIGTQRGPHYVVRFCEEWTDLHHTSKAEAWKLAGKHKAARDARLSSMHGE